MASAVSVATQFANAVARELSTSEDSYAMIRNMIKVRNKRDSMETYATGALATITFEGADDLMVAMTLQTKWINLAKASGFYFEPWASWQIAVWPL